MRHSIAKRAGGWFFISVMFAISSVGALAQNQPASGGGATDDAEWRRQTDAKIKQLEGENAELKKRVNDVATTQQAVMKQAQESGILSIEGGQPRLTTPDFFDVNKYVSEGDFPGSFRVPGAKTSFQLGGFVQLDAILDNNQIGNTDAFVVNTIPTGSESGGPSDTNFSIRQTRLFLKTQTPTNNWGNLITYVEIDFFGSGVVPRLRHAYGQIGDKFQFLAGQTWSAFQDATVFPATLDFQGPPGIITSRRPQVRFRDEFSKEWIGVVSLEDPTSEITTPGGFAGHATAPAPDLDGNIRWSPDWGHLQLSGVLRYLQFDPDVGSRQSDWGYGGSLTGAVNTIKLDEKHVDSVLFQIADGIGIARYINDSGGLGLDAVIGAPGENLQGLRAVAGMAAYQHWWHSKWASTLGYSFVTIDNAAGESGSDYHSGQYAMANLRFYPADRVLIGGEVLYGVREDADRSKGDDVRVQFSVQYRF